MIDSALDAEKSELRARLRERLRGLGPMPADDARRAQERLLESGLLDGLACVALYRALPSEVPCARLEEALRGRGVRLCLPRVAAEKLGAPSISAVLALEFGDADGPLQRSHLGFEQPHEGGAPVPLDRIDAFVVPCRAADGAGNRLGRGRGHYDATLVAHPRALRIGLLREAQLVSAVPVSAHDQPLDALCTEARILLCSPRARERSR